MLCSRITRRPCPAVLQVLGNKLAGMGLFVENQALVRATVQLIARLSFNDPSLNLTQILDNLQQEFCKVGPVEGG